jgi:hypothetical protein
MVDTEAAAQASREEASRTYGEPASLVNKHGAVWDRVDGGGGGRRCWRWRHVRTRRGSWRIRGRWRVPGRGRGDGAGRREQQHLIPPSFYCRMKMHGSCKEKTPSIRTDRQLCSSVQQHARTLRHAHIFPS